MYQRLLLSGVLIFCSTSIHNIILLHKSRSFEPVLDLSKKDRPNKKSTTAITPFWETNKKAVPVDTTALKQSNWYADIIKNIEASEYEIKKDDKTGQYCGPNRQQQLRASFNYNSFTLQPRSKDKGWTLSMQVSGIYTDKKLIAQPGEKDLPVVGSNKIVFNNNNFSTEYINSKEGVRQNFIIQKEPASKPQTINIKLKTNKSWYINKVHDKELHFAKLEGDHLSKKITYNSLKVWDATNKELVARFVVNKKHNAFEIEVNTIDAVYPITIDPISTTPAAIVESNQADAQMGRQVSAAGDVNGDGYGDVIVGAWLYDNGQTDEGVAFIYHGSATGISTTAAIMLEANQAFASFGSGVAGAGDVNGDGYSDVIVGAYLYDNGEAEEGAAFIYHGSATGIGATPAAMVQSDQVNAQMGFFTAGAGDVNGDGYSDIIVGANLYDNGESDEGAAFIYLGSAAGINTAVATLVESNQASSNFGREVAGAGDVNGDGYSDVIVGAWGFDNGENDEGAAFVYYGSAAGIITPAAVMLESNQADATLGISVASAGDVNGDGYSDVIVGAYFYDNGQADEGAAFIYLGSASGISATAATILDNNQPVSRFGASVDCAGDLNGDGYSDVIVGSYFYDNGQADEGAVFVYYGSAIGINSTAVAILESNQTNAVFGICLSAAGDVNGDGYSDIIVGAFWYDNGQSDEGAAFVYNGSPDGLKITNDWQVLEPQAGANYGLSVASAGDVNSDGFSDVIVGAYIYDQGLGDNGKAYLYMGSASGLSTIAAWTAIGTMANEYFGRAVASAGDVNGDGYGDVIIGAYGYSNGQSQEGRAYLYYGSSGGLAGAFAWTYENNFAGSVLGVSVGAAGDVNHDGYADIIIGAPQYDDGVTTIDEGKAYLFYGTATVPASTPDWTAEGNLLNANFGVSVAGLGDANGDGYSDVIIGAHLYNDGFAGEGKAFAYYGSSTGLPLTPNWTAKGNQLNANFGISVSSAGDINGDGFSDAIVGAFSYDDGTTDEGAAFVYHGSSTGLSLTANWTGENNLPNTLYGYTVSSAGDVNGDGYSDVLIGARNISNGQTDEGALYAYYGSSTGLSLSTSWYVESNVATSLLGNSVASAGDVNGDGYSDVIGGAPYYNGLRGAAFIYYGNNNTGLQNNLKLYNTDLTTPIGQFNITEPNLFGAGLFSKSPLGRVKGRLVWEVKKQGDAFSGNPITNSVSYLDKASYLDLGIAGIELKSNVQKVGRKNNKIRTRVEYDKATAITGQVYGPWRYPAAYVQGAHGMNSIPLPVKLNDFNGALIADKVKLQWSSSDDEDVATYQIQRSNDNRNFATIGSTNSIHQNGNDYNFTDLHPLQGTSWYRLLITDEYNRFSYSKTIVIKNNNNTAWVYPTVISKGESVNLQFKNAVAGSLEIQLINSGGVLVLRKRITASGNTVTIELPSLSSGVYILSVMQNGEKLITQKIIIR